MRAGERVYGMLLRLYPRAFRRRYSGRLVDAFRRQRAEHEAAGGGAVSFWASIVADALASSARLRAEAVASGIGSVGGRTSGRGRGGRDSLAATILTDVRYAWRSLRRNPSFGLAAVATIALSIGAATAVFAVVDVTLIRPLPLEDPDRLLYLGESNPDQVGSGVTSPATFRDWERETTSFEGFAASTFNSRVYSEDGRAEILTVADVNDGFFEVLGRDAQVGRVFASGEAERGEWLAVLSDWFWRSRFGADPGVIGRTLRLDDRLYTVVGVMPARFALPEAVPVWTLETWAGETGRAGRHLGVAGRLAPGRTAAQAEAELDAIAARLAETFPATNEGWDVAVTPLRDSLIGQAAVPIRLIGVSVALLLLVASFNVAGLMLARSIARRRELAVRQALGGGWRITRLLVSETLVVAGIGGLVGVGLAYLLVGALVSSPPVDIPLIETVSVDGRALVFAAMAVLTTGLFFGFVPAWRVAAGTSTGAVDTLRTAAGTGAGRRSGAARMRSALVVGEIAVAVVLVIGAGLLLRSLLALHAVDPGFETEGRVAARVFPAGPAFSDPAQRTAWVRRVEENVAALPGVRAVGTINVLPMDRIGVNFDLAYGTHRTVGVAPQDLPQAEFRVASGRIFEALGIDVVRGRVFRESDDDSAPLVAVINESLAAQAFAGGEAIGERMTVHWGAAADYEVIGVVGDTYQSGLTGGPSPQIYVHFPQFSLHFGSTNVVAAADVDPTSLLRGVEDAVLAADPGLPAHTILTVESLVADSIARERFATTLLAGLALLSLILAALGLYGLVSYVVRQRSRELAIRMALGARRVDAIGAVMRQSVLLALAGATTGVIGAVATASLVENLLFGVSSVDPLTYLAVGAMLVVVAVLAAARPALLAANADPAGVLRQE